MPIMLSDCVAHVESSGNHLAMRFEPAWQASQEGIDACAAHVTGGWIDNTTAANICATSYGMYQVMADNLYGKLAFKGTLAQYITSRTMQYASFVDFIKSIGFTDAPFDTLTTEQVNDFAIHYNGSIVYAHSLHDAYALMAANTKPAGAVG